MTLICSRLLNSRRGRILVGVEYPAVSEVARPDLAADDMREPLAYLSKLPADQFDIEVVPEIPEAYLAEQGGTPNRDMLALLAARRFDGYVNHSRR